MTWADVFLAALAAVGWVAAAILAGKIDDLRSQLSRKSQPRDVRGRFTR